MTELWNPDPCSGEANWTPDPGVGPPWSSDPCLGDAGWKPLTICRRPYGLGPYGLGPYGRCAIVGGADWGEVQMTIVKPAARRTWRRRARV
jgi:hypothetical protein